MRTGCPWADLPKRFGKANSVCRRFRRLTRKGGRGRAFLALQAPDLDWLMLEFAHHARPPAGSRPKESTPDTECLGRNLRGIGTKIHACTEALDNAVHLIATAEQAGDSPQALPLLADLQPDKVLADSAYDSGETRAYYARHPHRSHYFQLA